MDKKLIIEAINKVSLSNNDLGKFGDGFDKALDLLMEELNKIPSKNENTLKFNFPNNLIIYRQARELNYSDFCKWINPKISEIRA